MFIEIHIRGELKKRWEITDDNFAYIEGASFEENVIARELVIDRYLTHFTNFVAPLFEHEPDVKFYLVFESKLNNETITEND